VIAEVLGRKFVSPEYAAVRVWVPRENVLVVNAALPARSGIEESAVVPSSTMTLPVGRPLVVLAACIANVTGSPRLGLPVEADNAVSVGACVMLRLAGVNATV
jgi:hypothetical protein